MKHIFFFLNFCLHETIALPSWYRINMSILFLAQKYFSILFTDKDFYPHVVFPQKMCFSFN